MARRMEIELTSKRDDGTWTWRAAGAREPKGTLDGALVPPATQVGEVVKVEVEGFLDGITVVSVVPPKAPRTEPERIDLLTPRSEGPLVTTRLARGPRRESGGRRGDRAERGDRGDRGERGDRDHRGRRRSDRGDRTDRGPRSDRDRDRDRDRGDRSERGDRADRRERHPAPPPVEAKPKPKRLRPAKAHRSALLEALPAEQRPIAEQLLQGGIPAVRQAIEKQNDELKAAGKSQVAAEPLLEIAERLRNRAQAAAWRDRADAALAQVDDLDLRDLRSVVNAADDGGRDEEARNVATQLREALTSRLEKEQVAWVDEVAENLRDGRVVRALRLSSRPPKAGSPLPPDLSAQLIAATGAALTAETGPQRWATILDALAFSPIRRRVVPESLPDKLNAELRGTIARLGTRLPEVAHIFDITPEEAPTRPPRQGNQARRGKGGGAKADQPEGRSRPRKRRGDKPKPADADTKPGSPTPRSAPEADTPTGDTDAATTDDAGAPATEATAGTEGAPEISSGDEAIAANAAGTEAAAQATTPPPPEAAAEATPEGSADQPSTDAPDETAPEAQATTEAADAEVRSEITAPEPAAASGEAGGEPTPTMVDEAADAEAAPSGSDEVPADEAGGEPDAAMAEEAADAAEAPNGTGETNGESSADAADSVRIDS